jgi:hypothetical protein
MVPPCTRSYSPLFSFLGTVTGSWSCERGGVHALFVLALGVKWAEAKQVGKGVTHGDAGKRITKQHPPPALGPSAVCINTMDKCSLRVAYIYGCVRHCECTWYKGKWGPVDFDTSRGSGPDFW